MALKIIDASEVIARGVKKSIAKKVAKIDTRHDDKSGDIGNAKTDHKNIVMNSIKPDNKGEDKSSERPHITDRVTRTIKLKQSAYYGTANENKSNFMRMYKELGFKWRTEIINKEVVDGWFNEDKSQYIIKLSEEGEYKRFKFYGCDEIYDYFISLGAVVFDYKENLIVSNKVTTDNIVGSKIENDVEKYEFVGADLWSKYRTRQLLKKVPDNWGVVWK